MTRAELEQARKGERFDGRLIDWTSHSYPTVSFGNKTRRVHLLVWELAHGPRPVGMHVHHIDFNRNNFSLENLSLETPTDHARIHAGWIRENGEWIARPCGQCRQVLPVTSFEVRKRLSYRCKFCTKRTERIGPKRIRNRYSRNRWTARITISGRRHTLGSFDTPELARQTYMTVAEKIGRTPPRPWKRAE